MAKDKSQINEKLSEWYAVKIDKETKDKMLK